jgi:hypothetical protein
MAAVPRRAQLGDRGTAVSSKRRSSPTSSPFGIRVPDARLVQTAAAHVREAYRCQSSSASRLTAGEAGFFDLSSAGSIGRVLPLRDDAFKAELAGVREHGRAIVLEMFVEQNARRRPGQERGERRLAGYEGSRRRSSPSSSIRSNAQRTTRSS